MTTVATRTRQIGELEGFDIVVTQNGQPVDLKANGVLGAYDFARAARDAWTVNRWRQDRFQAAYPGFSCDVLMDDGTPATGQMLLRTVRESYQGD